MKDGDKGMNTAAAPAPVKKSRGKLFLLLVILLVLGGGAAAGAYFWMARNAAPEKAEDAEKIGPNSGILPLEQFTVNLADKDASRFLRATVQLVIDKGEEAESLKEDTLKLMRVRSSVLELLTVQTSDHVVTPEGKAELKHLIAQRTSAILAPVKVIDVLFSDFVVQF